MLSTQLISQYPPETLYICSSYTLYQTPCHTKSLLKKKTKSKFSGSLLQALHTSV